jgi:ribosome-binding factor A
MKDDNENRKHRPDGQNDRPDGQKHQPEPSAGADPSVQALKRGTKRSRQVASVIQTEISDIIRKRLRDPRIGFTTITEVEIASDLKTAKVYVSVMGDDKQKKETLKALERARTLIQNELGQRVSLRYIPMLFFYMDESAAYGDKIDRLLNTLRLDEKTEAEA